MSNVDELFDMAAVLTTCPLPKGNRVAILSEGGGDNSIAADNAETYGMEVPVLSQKTQEKIKPFVRLSTSRNSKQLLRKEIEGAGVDLSYKHPGLYPKASL